MLWKGYPDSENSWVPHYNCSNSSDLIREFYKRNPTAIGNHELALAAMKPPPVHKNFSLSHLPDGGIVPRAKAEGSIMLGIICPSKKAQKARKPLSKLTKLTDLNQTVNQKWVTAAPRNLRVIQYELVNQHGCQKLVTQGFFATWTRYLLDNVEGIGGQDSGGIA
ncbi:hypothetical protein DSO57_1004723 [Entomophthora muscae]|uniref:Uncharacterized protein n=1 Tax=Entomophthora muscae TaxID=34485 RepID=A0ACC2TJ60_9FUNG|nr:hypothetical protein DSO57_1004723 [Entomophthora muscae]